MIEKLTLELAQTRVQFARLGADNLIHKQTLMGMQTNYDRVMNQLLEFSLCNFEAIPQQTPKVNVANSVIR